MSNLKETPVTSETWSLAYNNEVGEFSMSVVGTSEEAESHARNLGCRVEGQVISFFTPRDMMQALATIDRQNDDIHLMTEIVSGRVSVSERVQLMARSLSETAASRSHVLQRIAHTVIQHSTAKGPSYAPNVCHGRVAQEILRRGNIEDRIWLFGAKSGGGEVTHSVLTDENDHPLADGWAKTFNGRGFHGRQGYGDPHDPHERMDFLQVVTVRDLYEEFQA